MISDGLLSSRCCTLSPNASAFLLVFVSSSISVVIVLYNFSVLKQSRNFIAHSSYFLSSPWNINLWFILNCLLGLDIISTLSWIYEIFFSSSYLFPFFHHTFSLIFPRPFGWAVWQWCRMGYQSMADSRPKGPQLRLGHLRVGELQPLSPMFSTRPCCLV